MAVKYFFSYKDTEEVLHECEISNDGFVGSATEIAGAVYLEYPEVSDPLEPIRGSGLKIDLEANLGLTLSDLYTEEERSYQVVYKRAGTVKFRGFLKPDGVYQDWVRDQWVISLDCVDGLGLLENLSYVNATGNKFTGKQTALEIIVNCLVRTELQLNINTSINVFYTGLLTSVDVLDNVYLNADRFIKDEERSTIMSCQEVLKSVLDSFSACICQQDGEWFIYRPNKVASTPTITFHRYDYTGASLSPDTQTINLSGDFGSHINGRYPHHVNENQRIEVSGSIGAFKVNYKYGFVRSLFDNTDLVHNTSVVEDMTILSSPDITLSPGGKGFRLLASTNEVQTIKMTSPISVIVDDEIEFSVTFRFVDQVSVNRMLVTLTSGGSTWYMDNSGTWNTSLEYVTALNGSNLEFTINRKSNPVPSAGDIDFIFYNPPETFDPNGYSEVSYFSIAPLKEQSDSAKGENHVFQRTTKPSSLIKDTKVIYNGDTPTDLYVGAIYESDQVTNTETWFREGVSESKCLICIMGEDALQMNAKPAQIFSGDIYGYLDYLRLISIDSISGKFMPLGYVYDTRNNIISLKLREVFNDTLTDVSYDFSLDYGSDVKPTIKN